MDYLAERRALLAGDEVHGVALCRALSRLTDRWLAPVFNGEEGVALVAVGGYGRRELCPGSDLDLVLVHGAKREVGPLAERLWYPIWDAGVSLDHSVRTVKEALAVADANLEAALGLLDARAVAGDAALAAELAERARAQWRKRARPVTGDLAQAVAGRHARAGEVAFLLEPDLKEGRGGVRDVHAVRALAAAVPVVGDGGALLAGAHDVLLGARAELQRRTGKAGNRLLLQEQDAVAAALGHRDADALMAAVAAAARTVAWTTDDSLRRVASWRKGPRGRAAGGDRPVAPGVVVREDEVHLAPGADIGDRSLVLRVAAAAAQMRVPIADQALDRLDAEAAGPGGPSGVERWPPEARQALVALLGSGHAAVPVLETLDQKGLLVKVLPEWASVRSLPQRNAYHRYTVDRHLCEAAAGAAALTRRVARPDLLLVGAWLHDLGKGFPGDHTDAGVDLMAVIGERMGFDPDDVAVLVAMVRHHLLLPDTATRRDLSDPATLSAVAEAVGDRDRLELLAALSEADSRATGDSAWSPWKESLVAQLVAAVSETLRGEPPPPPAFPGPEHRQLLARADGSLRVEMAPDGAGVVVVAPDRPGLFCAVAGALALHGLNVLAADAWSSEDGMAVEELRVEHAFGRAVDPAALAADLEAALDGRLPLETRLAERARTYGRRPAGAVRAPEPQVLVDRAASRSATVVEVRAADGVGVLWTITSVLSALGFDVTRARVTTMGQEVVDSFYVQGDEGRIAELAPAIVAALGR